LISIDICRYEALSNLDKSEKEKLFDDHIDRLIKKKKAGISNISIFFVSFTLIAHFLTKKQPVPYWLVFVIKFSKNIKVSFFRKIFFKRKFLCGPLHQVSDCSLQSSSSKHAGSVI